MLLGPLARWPRAPLLAARFGLAGVFSARALARIAFKGERARALLAGSAAHSMQPLSGGGTGAFGLVLLTLAHACGWPVARGGSEAIALALRAELESLGASIQTGVEVRSLEDLPELRSARAILFDLTPRQLLAICGPDDLPEGYRRALERFRYGPGVFKVDYALSGPLQWTASECRIAGTVHLGGSLARDLGVRGRCRPGAATNASVRLGLATERDRSFAGACRQAHSVGVLSCPQRVGCRHDDRD